MDLVRTLSGAGEAIRLGKLRSSQLVDDALSQIDKFDADLRAWESVDREGALRAAHDLDALLAAGHDRGPLHGIPIGVKDIIDVAGLPTRAGSPLRQDHVANVDAPVVAHLRRAGAVILGKTVTTEFAAYDPPPTRNPWNLAHTPGGSSSGSAAATAMRMCLGAIGTQTGGSIVRPATYCGVAGFKPTYDRLSRDGLVPLSPHLDHVGPIGLCAADLFVLFAAMQGTSHDEHQEFSAAQSSPPRLGVISAPKNYFRETCDPAVLDTLYEAIGRLQAAGALSVELAPLPAGFEAVHAMHRRIMAYEVARFHKPAYMETPDKLGQQLRSLIAEGLQISAGDYEAALDAQRKHKRSVRDYFKVFDAILTPATPSTAPTAETTGDPRFNSPWSYLGVPTASLPCGLVDGLPIGLQLIGGAGSDAHVLGVAAWCERALNVELIPPMLLGAAG